MLFASDLDNTLIHSYKVADKRDICVEIKDGKALSFMPRDSFSLLKEISQKCVFVPVTTRSLEQYRRLDLGVSPKYALVAHGAVLLVDGQVEKRWLSETRSIFDTRLPDISENEFIYDVRNVNGFFIFAKSKNPEQAVKRLKTAVGTNKYTVCGVHNKVYIFPKGLTKRAALERLKRRLLPEKVICAGDSKLDVSMLKTADVALVPENLKSCVDNAVVLDGGTFVSRALPTVNKFLN